MAEEGLVCLKRWKNHTKQKQKMQYFFLIQLIFFLHF